MILSLLLWLTAWGSLLAPTPQARPLDHGAGEYPAYSDTVRTPHPTSPDTTLHPNEVPYETRYGAGYHLLALPSYLLHWVTRPIGEAVEFYEQSRFGRRTRTLIFDETQPVTLSPLIEFGGPLPASIGAGLTWREAFGMDHTLEVSYRFSTLHDMRGALYYEVPRLFSPTSYTYLEGIFHLDSRNRLFLGGNESTPENQANFRIEHEQISLVTGSDPHLAAEPTSRLGWSLKASYRRINTGEGRGDALRPLPTRLPGLGSEHYATLGGGLVADAGKYFRYDDLLRTVAGTRIRLGYEFNQALNPNADSYHFMLAEWQQYIPLYSLGPARRLSFGARLEKRETVTTGDEVPFYDLSTLGNRHSLRGYDYNRFRDEGALFVTAEYHYPIWGGGDLVLFADGGQVFDEFADVSLDAFHWSFGAGVHVFSRRGLAVRFEIGFTPEGYRAFSQSETLFERSAHVEQPFR